jgi:hypothetical protein
MKTRYLARLFFAVAILGSAPAAARVSEKPPGLVPAEFTEPRAVIGTYLKAVDRGELEVFDRKLDRSMIIPTRVEYVYDLESPTPQIKVHADIKQPMSVPDHGDCEIRGVTAILNRDGQIVETEAHVWPKQ